MNRFDGKVAFVTGGGTGIGLACANAIAEGGGRVVLAGRRAEVVQAASENLGDSADFVVCNVTDDGSVEQAVGAVVERHGRLDLAVNSAGTGAAGSVLSMTPVDFAATVDTNLHGVFRTLRAEARVMKKGGGGSIVNVSSIAGVATHPWMSAYCASKAGVNMLTRCAADELGEYGIRVNAVMPGVVDTEMASLLVTNEHSRAEYLSLMPISRIGEPADVGQLVGFLLSDDASWVTGQCIAVDGGHTLRKGPDLVPMFREFIPEDD
jgi:NAD(P)-dependent dehydrogenase (short-subunit alcohol dehydrogenase family)